MHKDNENKNNYTPFDSVEEVWFWFIAAQAARNDGARYVAGMSSIRRPCEPVDILKILDRLYRNRRITRNHLLVLRHYGRRYMAPDPLRVKEKRSYYIWKEALDRMEPILEGKGIIVKPHWASQYMSEEYAGEQQCL